MCLTSTSYSCLVPDFAATVVARSQSFVSGFEEVRETIPYRSSRRYYGGPHYRASNHCYHDYRARPCLSSLNWASRGRGLRPPSQSRPPNTLARSHRSPASWARHPIANSGCSVPRLLVRVQIPHRAHGLDGKRDVPKAAEAPPDPCCLDIGSQGVRMLDHTVPILRRLRATS